MDRQILLLVALAAAVGLAATASASTIYVNGTTGDDAWDGQCETWDGDTCGPKLTIQAGMDAAVVGDEVVIADGTYTGAGNKNLDFGGKAITVRSASRDPALCIIDCESDGRGFTFNRGEGPDSIIEGLMITNGGVDDDYAGGVYCENSSPTLTRCTISGNVTAYDGGGVYCYNSSPVLTNCTISGNEAAYDGGGVYCRINSSPILTNCAIDGNTVSTAGGGVYCYSDSSPTLTNCMIRGNFATLTGGAIYCYLNSSPALINCTIRGNEATDGGGLHCHDNSNLMLTKCIICGNRADNGGGVYCYSSSPTFTNCTIGGNTASEVGGGVRFDGSSATITNCTLAANTATLGAALACDSFEQRYPSTVMMSNGILWNGTDQIWNNDESTVALDFCDVQGGWPGDGNIEADPQFAFANEFHLMPGSPCIDAATNTPLGGLPADDLDGNPRPLDGDGDAVAVADMGAYEFNSAAPSIALSRERIEISAPEGGEDPAEQALSLRNCGGGTLNWEITGQPAWLTVSPSAGSSDGVVNPVSLRANVTGLAHGAYPALLEVADPQAVNSPREVRVALYVTTALHVPGSYPTIQAAIDASVNGDVVEIANGTWTGPGNKHLDFGGKAITVRSASRDPTLCIIDCESDGRGFLFRRGEGPTAIVEGLTITNGSADGGGIRCVRSSPSLVNCLIRGNTGGSGGVSCQESSSPTLTDCTISGNSADLWGGGVYCSDSNPTLANCAISDNAGGGVYCHRSSPTIIDCSISDNSSDQSGGGITCLAHSSPSLTDCTIGGNSAVAVGGGVHCDAFSAPTFAACAIVDNTASYGGGIACTWSSSPTLTNCAISGNSADQQGGGVLSVRLGNPTLVNCTLAANTASLGPALACDSPGQFFPSTVEMSNCILWNGADQIWNNDESTVSLTYCDIQSGWPGEGNIDADPLFVDPDGPDDDPATWEDNDHHLSPGSPCVDAGDPAFAPHPGEADVDGHARVLCGRVDMGAYEFGVGDFDCNGVIDLIDYAFWPACVTGPDGSAYDAGCEAYDSEYDGDVDLLDFAAFQYLFQPRLLGDFNEDGVVDLDDYAAWDDCFTGPDAGPYDPGCAVADFDGDGYVDLKDFGGFQAAFTG